MIIYGILGILVFQFALNMGGGNFSASFAAAHGGGGFSKRKSQILFCIFVFLGAVSMGQPVTETLSRRIIPSQLMSADIAMIVIFAATVSLWVANFLHVSQSASLVTVGSIAGVGLYLRQISGETFVYMVAFWALLPVVGYLLSFFLGRVIYPPRQENFWIYEKFVNHSGRLRTFVILASCFNAFSVGTNNVANAVGPLVGAGLVDKTIGLILVAPVFGLGSFVFCGPLKTTSREIVPLGLLTATIICFVTGCLMIMASFAGVPQSFVMIKLASVFAISTVKNGHRLTFSNPAARKTCLTWVITPVIAFTVSYVLTAVRYSLFP